MSKPQDREAFAGQIAAIKAECTDIMRNQIANADHFIIEPQDCACYDEYANILTARELGACFRAAQR